MAVVTPRPPHQWHFDAEPVFRYKNGVKVGVDGINVKVGYRTIYLDLPQEEEIKLDSAIEMVDFPPILSPKTALVKSILGLDYDHMTGVAPIIHPLIEKPLPKPPKRTLGVKLKALISA